jgi:tetratricopeptide (TPR) repeat protein
MKTTMNLRHFLAIGFVFTALAFVSCSPSRSKQAESIKNLEVALQQAPNNDTNAVNELMNAYLGFAEKFPKDTLAPEMLYRAGGLAVGFGKGNKAIDYFGRILKSYESWKKFPETLFMMAFTYENVLNDVGNANLYYNKFLAKYPSHELADDAEAAIKNLGKSPEELVREFEKKNADSTGTALQTGKQ